MYLLTSPQQRPGPAWPKLLELPLPWVHLIGFTCGTKNVQVYMTALYLVVYTYTPGQVCCMGQVRLPAAPVPPSPSVVTVDRGQLLTTSLPSLTFCLWLLCTSPGSSVHLSHQSPPGLLSHRPTQLLPSCCLPGWLAVDPDRALPSRPRGPTSCHRSAALDTVLTSSTPFSPGWAQAQAQKPRLSSPSHSAPPLAPAPPLQGRHVAVSASILVLFLVLNISAFPVCPAQRRRPTSRSPMPRWLLRTSTSSPSTRITAAWLSVSAAPPCPLRSSAVLRYGGHLCPTHVANTLRHRHL